MESKQLSCYASVPMADRKHCSEKNLCKHEWNTNYFCLLIQKKHLLDIVTFSHAPEQQSK